MYLNNEFKFIDLFCGIGAFHQAAAMLGGTCVYACDIDKSVRSTYEKNYALKPDSDITQVDEATIPEFDILFAGFPCQAFSKAGKRLGFEDPTKGTLFFDVMRILKFHKPKYALLENVRNLAYHDNGNTWKVIYKSLTDAGYYVQREPVILSPHYFGVPQHRERVFIMCVRRDSDVDIYPDFCINTEKLPKCNAESILLDDSEIENIEKYKLSLEQIEWIDNWNSFIKNIDILPGFPVWTEYFREIDDSVLSGMPKWKQNFIIKNSELYDRNKEFLDKWLIKAKENKLFFGSKAKLEWQAGTSERDIWKNIMQIRPSGLRVKPGTYYPALVAMNQTSIIGSRKRILTPRECARIQSFPDGFKIDENEGQAYKQFGNSINVDCALVMLKYMIGDKETRELYSFEKEFPDEVKSNELF